jgi:hypothetical protein
MAREHDDPATLAACLLARHDVLWTPSRAAERVDLAREIAELGTRIADPERRAEGLLLTATALLEQGSAAFRVAVPSTSTTPKGSVSLAMTTSC